MKFVFLVAGCLLLNSAFSQLVINDPNAVLRSVPEFHSIKISGGIDVLLTKGTEQAVVVSGADGNNGQSIVTEVKNGVLNISGGGVMKINHRKALKAYISYTTLESIIASGAVNVTFAESITQDRLNVTLSGASKIKATVNILKMEMELTGASDARLSGFTEEFILNCSGASDFKSFNLVAQSCEANISGASDAQITVETYLKVDASGASDFTFKGSPKKTDIKKSGSSDVSNRN